MYYNIVKNYAQPEDINKFSTGVERFFERGTESDINKPLWKIM